MGLLNYFVVICIKIFNFKGSTMIMLLSALKYITLNVVINMTIYVIDFYFAKVYRNGPSFHL